MQKGTRAYIDRTNPIDEYELESSDTSELFDDYEDYKQLEAFRKFSGFYSKGEDYYGRD